MPATYLPSDDSTSGFDNIAGALGISSTLVEAYVTAAQKIARLALGVPEPPTLAIYRPREDTSQDYHIEGLPFGTRGGMLVDHLFPSDGEYTITVTPIFRRQHVASRIRFGALRAPCASCWTANGWDCWTGREADGSRPPTVADAGKGPYDPARQGRRRSLAAADGAPMRVRFTTTAGRHRVGVTFLATHYAPLLDLDRHFRRSTIQTGPTPGYTFFPHVGTIRIEGPYNATTAGRFTEPPANPHLQTRQASPTKRRAPARILGTLATQAYRRPAIQSDVDLLMQFYAAGRQ